MTATSPDRQGAAGSLQAYLRGDWTAVLAGHAEAGTDAAAWLRHGVASLQNGAIPAEANSMSRVNPAERPPQPDCRRTP